jgi:hypothetical protein
LKRSLLRGSLAAGVIAVVLGPVAVATASAQVILQPPPPPPPPPPPVVLKISGPASQAAPNINVTVDVSKAGKGDTLWVDSPGLVANCASVLGRSSNLGGPDGPLPRQGLANKSGQDEFQILGFGCHAGKYVITVTDSTAGESASIKFKVTPAQP